MLTDSASGTEPDASAASATYSGYLKRSLTSQELGFDHLIQIKRAATKPNPVTIHSLSEKITAPAFRPR